MGVFFDLAIILKANVFKTFSLVGHHRCLKSNKVVLAFDGFLSRESGSTRTQAWNTFWSRGKVALKPINHFMLND